MRILEPIPNLMAQGTLWHENGILSIGKGAINAPSEVVRISLRAFGNCVHKCKLMDKHALLSQDGAQANFFYFFYVFRWAGPRPHIPFPSRPHFVCKFSRHGSSSPVTSHLAPGITVLVFPDSADAYSLTTASYRLTQIFRPNTRE